jgi:hypothetical protein
MKSKPCLAQPGGAKFNLRAIRGMIAKRGSTSYSLTLRTPLVNSNALNRKLGDLGSQLSELLMIYEIGTREGAPCIVAELLDVQKLR